MAFVKKFLLGDESANTDISTSPYDTECYTLIISIGVRESKSLEPRKKQQTVDEILHTVRVLRQYKICMRLDDEAIGVVF